MGVDCIQPAQDSDHSLEGSCQHGNEPMGSIRCGEFD